MLRRIAVVIVIIVATFGLIVPTASARPKVHYYLALGDSLSVGVQPGAPPDFVNVEGRGYVDDLWDTLKKSDPSLQLKKLGCSGESTTTMITGGICQYDAGSQLAEAKQFIKDNPGQVTQITLTIGSNDVLRSTSGQQCASTAGIDAACALAGIGDVKTNLPQILDPLRDLTGRTAIRAGMTYYDPFLAAYLQGPPGQALALQSLIYINTLNGVLASGLLRNGFRVAPVSLKFRTNDFTPQNTPGLGTVPVNVANICTYTHMCTPAQNIHANDAGYQLIADVFAATFCRRF